MNKCRIFHDRADAGKALAPAVKGRALQRPLVLGLPRGGVPVAFEVAKAIDAELDVLVVRKLGVPYEPELAFGAIASGGVRVFNDDVMQMLPELDEAAVNRIVAEESSELARREAAFRGDRPYPAFTNRDIVLVDDGLATGATMRAALQAVRRGNPRRVLVAVPTGPAETVKQLSGDADDVICLDIPAYFMAIGSYYERFDQVSDEEVRQLLDQGRLETSTSASKAQLPAHSRSCPTMLRNGDALLIVDVQRDFLPGGALAVADGDAIVAPLSACARRFAERDLPVFASRDWHPADHCSFREKGGPWPSHCVAKTPGADFAPALELPPGTRIIDKATSTGKDAYSAFDGTDLNAQLAELGVRRVFIGGLATEYCVAASAEDALRAGYDVVLLTDAVRAIDPAKGRETIGSLRLRHAAVAACDEVLDAAA
jgi:predicted phosphoribosyltransferase/nicotinamidase-related amidase